MGVMTAIAFNYIASSSNSVWNTILRHFELVGYSRAAVELQRLGYHNEAVSLMTRYNELKRK